MSRILRRARLRTTAPPTLRDAMIPARIGPSPTAGATAKVINDPRQVLPSVRTRSNSDVRVRRRDLGKAKRRDMSFKTQRN